MGGITKSLYELITGSTAGIPDATDVIPFCPKPGTAFVTEIKNVTLADLEAAIGGGDVNGPGIATDNAAARFDGTTGKLLQNSLVTIADNGDVVTPTDVKAATYHVGADPGVDATVVVPTVGTLTFKKGILTDFTP